MRKQFDIKYRPQIESGEYKVETRDGRPARVICWDKADECGQCIVALVQYTPKHENMISVCEDGIYKGTYGHCCDLFIVTPEPEMSEMEILLFSWLSHDTGGRTPMKQEVKARATKLLDLAKQQLLQSGELLTQEHHEKLMETLREECTKDLPRWKKATGKERFNKRVIVLVGDNDLLCTNYAEEGEYYLPFSDLEKLPKEDEDHE